MNITNVFVHSNDDVIATLSDNFEWKQPFHFKKDLQWLKEYIKGKWVVMSKKTYQNTSKSFYKDCDYIWLLTHTPDYSNTDETLAEIDSPQRILFSWFDNYLTEPEQEIELVVLGGKEIYDLFEPFANKIISTKVRNLNIKDFVDPLYSTSTKDIVINESKWKPVSIEPYLDTCKEFPQGEHHLVRTTWERAN